MKLLFLPLKLVTEAIWFAGRVGRRVTGRKRPWETRSDARQASPEASAAPPAASGAEAQRAWSSPKGGGGAGSAAFASYRGQGAAEGGALAVGDRVTLTDGARVKDHAVPAGAMGRIEAAGDGAYSFLWYRDDGAPILVEGVPAAKLRAA